MARAPSNPPPPAQGDPRDNVLEGELVDVTERAIVAGSITALAAMGEQSLAVRQSQADLDQLIVTAHKFPRDHERVVTKIEKLATLTTESATECNYGLPRGRDRETGKPKIIEGPSVRLAEIVASQWGNCRVGSHVVDVDRSEKVVISEGIFLDLETNYETRHRTRRRISDSKGRLYNDDMIVMTGNAASSIAFRNAVWRAIPRGIYWPTYQQCLKIIAGDVKNISERRVLMLANFEQNFKVKPAQILAVLGVTKESEIGPAELRSALAYYMGLKNNETTVEDMLRDAAAAMPFSSGGKALAAAFGAKEEPKAEPAKEEAKPASPPPPPPPPPPAAKAPAKVDTPPHDPETGEVQGGEGESSQDTSGGSPEPEAAAAINGPAPIDTVYMLAGFNEEKDGRIATYKNGEAFSIITVARSAELDTYTAHSPGAGLTPDPETNAETQADDGDAGPEFDEEAFGEYGAKLDAAESWLVVKAVHGAFRKTDAFQEADGDLQRQAKAAAYQAGKALADANRDPVKVEADPSFFALWLATNPPAAEVKTVWAVLSRADAYRKLPEEAKDDMAEAASTAMEGS